MVLLHRHCDGAAVAPTPSPHRHWNDDDGGTALLLLLRRALLLAPSENENVTTTATAPSSAGPMLDVDYLYFTTCWSVLGAAVLIVWLAVLMLFMKSTADLYLSGTLGVICNELHLSHEVAGSTFLALGNGAPDVFSSLAAFTHHAGTDGEGGDLGLGSLLGGASFVTTVVLGAVIFASRDEEGIRIRGESFGRDAAFLVAGVVWLLLVSSAPLGANIFTAPVFLLLYACYVVVVVKQARDVRRRDALGVSAVVMDDDDEEVAVPFVNKTAAAAGANDENGNGGRRREGEGGKKKSSSRRGEEDEDDDEDDDDDDELRRFRRADQGIENDPVVAVFGSSNNNDDEDADGVAALTTILDDHFRASSNASNSATEEEEEEMEDDFDPAFPPSPRQPQPPPPRRSSRTRSQRLHASATGIWNQLYWKRLRFARRYSKDVVDKLAESRDENVPAAIRALSTLALPLELLRSLTVPPPEAAAWSKALVVMHPPLCTLFFFFALGIPILHDPFATGCVIGSLLVSAYAHFALHDTRPPTGRTARLALALVSFVMSVLWIELAAGEIVAVVDALGALVGANSSIMGLSLLAWGNSVGDLVNNVAVVRTGFPQMAVSACVSGPVFNLLVGLGLSLTVLSARRLSASSSSSSGYHPHGDVELTMDKYAYAAATLLLSVLTLEMSWLWLCFPKSEWRLTRRMGLLIVSCYVVYSVSIVVLAEVGSGR